MEFHSDYKIIKATSTSELERMVNDYLENRWVIAGGVMAQPSGIGTDTVWYYQTIYIKREI